MLTEVHIHGNSGEGRLAVRSESRYQILTTELQVPERVIGELSGEGQCSVITPAEIAVKLGIVKVGAEARVQDFAPSDAVHLIPGFVFVTSFLTLAQRGVEHDVADGFNVNSDIYSLEQKLVDQSCTHNRCRCGGHVAEIVVIDIEEEPVARLKMNREIAAANAGAGTNAIGGDAARVVGNERVIDRDRVSERSFVLEEQIGTV